MRVLYVANHGKADADDEGAISGVLRELGHEVVEVPEREGYRASSLGGDLLLFHKWADPLTLRELQGKIRRVFWYFDLVWHPDPTLRDRCYGRAKWMSFTLPHADLGFCTDGGWVERAGLLSDEVGMNAHKLVWLPQGADQRVVGRWRVAWGGAKDCDILLVGGRYGGRERESFVQEMKDTYGARFKIVERGAHREELARLVQGARVGLAPDGPLGPRYCSNRIFVMLGYGAFLLHPWQDWLEEYYQDGRELVYYHDRVDLHDKLAHYLSPGARAEREAVALAGLERTRREHTYRQRVEALLKIVQEKLP